LSWGGQRRALGGSSDLAAMVAACCGAPMREGSGGQAGKLQGVEGNPFRGSAWAGDGRRERIDGE